MHALARTDLSLATGTARHPSDHAKVDRLRRDAQFVDRLSPADCARGSITGRWRPFRLQRLRPLIEI